MGKWNGGFGEKWIYRRVNMGNSRAVDIGNNGYRDEWILGTVYKAKSGWSRMVDYRRNGFGAEWIWKIHIGNRGWIWGSVDISKSSLWER